MFNIEIDNLIYFISLFTIIILVVFLMIYILISYFLRKQLNNKRKIEELKINHENNLLKSQIQVQEQTFQNISREIHDNVGQKLTLAKLRLNILDTEKNQNLSNEITETVQMLTQAINDLRDISRSMNSDLISNNGLVKTLENEISQLNRIFEYNFKLSVTGEVVYLDAEKELILFRIVQESLNNIIKHAEATQIFVDIHYTPNHLEIKVIDDGRGFDMNAVEESNGLRNIKTRTKMLNGTAEVISERNQGTIVTIKIPL